MKLNKSMLSIFTNFFLGILALIVALLNATFTTALIISWVLFGVGILCLGLAFLQFRDLILRNQHEK
jgi:cadmium resistance protein CadD (predicted permease)